MILGDWLRSVHADHLRLGYRSGNCDLCQPEPVAWHERARANDLPSMVVGGVPTEPRHPGLPPRALPVASPRDGQRSRQGVALALTAAAGG